MAKKMVWFIHRPTYGGMVQHPSLWMMEAVELDSDRDLMLSSGRTVNDCGELVELPGQWVRFEDQASAEAWFEEQRRLWEEWH